MPLFFGTAGIPLSTMPPTTQAGIKRLRELALDCLEIQFVQGVKMGERAALLVREIAKKERIKLSAHAPYFINLNAHEEEKIVASEMRLLQSARISALCGAESVILHTAYYLDDPPEIVYERVKRILERVISRLRKEGNNILIRPEVTGKITQFGSLDEVLNLSSEIEGVAPALDFPHLFSRTGKFNSYDEFLYILDMVEAKLGRESLQDMHIHISGIELGKGGERRHLLLNESSFRYKELLKALKDKNVSGVVICESPNLEGDALLLKEVYNLL